LFVGHYGLGLAGKKLSPQVSLGTWFMAVQFLDLLWPIFLLLGWEHVRIVPGLMKLSALDLYDYPISHSLVGALAWSFLFATAYQVLGRRATTFRTRRRAAILLGLGVFSHWILDVLVHRPDVPILPHGPYIGLGLWNVPPWSCPSNPASTSSASSSTCDPPAPGTASVVGASMSSSPRSPPSGSWERSARRRHLIRDRWRGEPCRCG